MERSGRTRPLRSARFSGLRARLKRWLGATLTTGEGENMQGKPDALVTMRLADMRRMHPAQDDTHVCAECGHPVGIYPSGQRALRQWPEMKVICSVCAVKRTPTALIHPPAADFVTFIVGGRESY